MIPELNEYFLFELLSTGSSPSSVFVISAQVGADSHCQASFCPFLIAIQYSGQEHELQNQITRVIQIRLPAILCKPWQVFSLHQPQSPQLQNGDHPMYQFSIAAVTSHYKFSGLKHLNFIIIIVLEVRNPKWVSLD